MKRGHGDVTGDIFLIGNVPNVPIVPNTIEICKKREKQGCTCRCSVLIVFSRMSRATGDVGTTGTYRRRGLSPLVPRCEGCRRPFSALAVDVRQSLAPEQRRKARF